MKQLIYTVGHSNQSAEEFLQLIKPLGIDCIIDVRSMPYSKYTPQFNEDVLKNFLKQNGVLYAPFGMHFGARRTDCLKEIEKRKKGVDQTLLQVNFELGTKTKDFLEGVERLKVALSQGRSIALMCSEADPLGCHRFSFISRFFYDEGYNVMHIVRSNTSNESIALTHKELEQIMINDYVEHHKLQPISGQGGLLSFDFGEDNYSETQQRIDAYRLKNQEIGWVSGQENEGNY